MRVQCMVNVWFIKTARVCIMTCRRSVRGMEVEHMPGVKLPLCSQVGNYPHTIKKLVGSHAWVLYCMARRAVQRSLLSSWQEA